MRPDTVVVIPSRLDSKRLFEKSLAMIQEKPMIVHVWEKAMQQTSNVIVACDDKRIAKAIEDLGGKVVLTDPFLRTGTDRVSDAVEKIDPEGQYRYVINLQGDLPYFDVDLEKLIPALEKEKFDWSTFVHPFQGPYQKNAPQAVKVVFKKNYSFGGLISNFSRDPLETQHYHIGIYGFKRESLRRFASLETSPRENIEKLEQLRALESGFSIAAVMIENHTFLSVDTKEDLLYVRSFLENKDHQKKCN